MFARSFADFVQYNNSMMLSLICTEFFMSKFDSPLDNVQIASPCSANWDEMYGDNRKRFCGDCKLNVYNLSGMTRDEAETLVTNADGRLCIRFYKRADGTLITEDCPVGWSRVKQRTKVFATAALSLIIALLSGVFFVSLFSKEKATVGRLLVPFLTPTPQVMMGAVAINPNKNSNTANNPQPKATMGNFAGPLQ